MKEKRGWNKKILCFKSAFDELANGFSTKWFGNEKMFCQRLTKTS